MRGVSKIPRIELKGEELQKAKLEALAKLTVQQRRFVEEYVNDFNTTQAATRVGYGLRSGPASAAAAGSRLLRKVPVQAAIAYLMAEKAEVAGLTTEWVILKLMENVEFARARGDAGAVNRALELLGKYKRLFVDTVDVTSKGEKLEAPAVQAQIMVIGGMPVKF